MRSEIRGACVVTIGNVRRESEDHRSFSARLWQIKRGVELDFIAHWNFEAPAQIVIRGRLSRRGRRHGQRRLPKDVRASKNQTNEN